MCIRDSPWQGPRIKEEDEYVRKYGLRNKRELWRAQTYLRTVRGQARTLLPGILRGEAQAQKEADQILARLNRLGLLEGNARLDDVLALKVDAVLGRRLQTVVYRKGLARSPKQARQFILHGHVSISGRRVNVPGHLVLRAEEPAVEWAPASQLHNEAHPSRPEKGGPIREYQPRPEPQGRGGGRGGPGRGGPPSRGQRRLQQVKAIVAKEGGETGEAAEKTETAGGE